MNNGEKAAITNTIQSYIEGYQKHNTDLLRMAFHSTAKLMAIEDGTINELATTEWFTKIDDKQKNGTLPLQFQSEILDIDYISDTAVAKVQLTFADFKFNDFLSLLKSADGWKITNKIYTKI